MKLPPLFLLVALLGCTPQRGDFMVVHHRANGCESDTPENSLAGMRCVARGCQARSAPCAFEVDVRVLSMEGGEVNGTATIVVMHDGSTARTADCEPAIELPGTSPISRERRDACRLLSPSGRVTDEPIPDLDQTLALVRGTELTAFVELKTSGDEALDALLVDEVVRRTVSSSIAANVVIASFDPQALSRVKVSAPQLRTACFTPRGGTLRQVSRVLADGVLSDVDSCLDDDHDFVFVPPNFLEGSVITHMRAAQKGLGVFGADTRDGFDQVMRWASSIDVVYADHPAMY